MTRNTNWAETSRMDSTPMNVVLLSAVRSKYLIKHGNEMKSKMHIHLYTKFRSEKGNI